MKPRSFAATDPGTVRTHNEDAFVDAPALGLWAVADGAGGHAAGELASGMLADALTDIPSGFEAEEMLAQVRLVVQAVHTALRDAASRRGDAMIASTLVVLVLRGGHFAALWAGDSRAYLLRGGALRRITTDHSLVQALIDEGAITEAQAEHHPQANVITRAVGAPNDSVELEKVLGDAVPGDIFLLCSDGLTKALDEVGIALLLLRPDPAAALVRAALDEGARDNVTAVVVLVPGAVP